MKSIAQSIIDYNKSPDDVIDFQSIDKSSFRIILIDPNEPKNNLPSGIDVLYGKAQNPEALLSHFVCVDDIMYRLENPHQKLTGNSDETDIKAKVCFNNPTVTRSLNQVFDTIWGQISVK